MGVADRISVQKSHRHTAHLQRVVEVSPQSGLTDRGSRQREFLLEEAFKLTLDSFGTHGLLLLSLEWTCLSYTSLHGLEIMSLVGFTAGRGVR